ncbi:hypothetical protein BT96DRAFT_913625 [Gymnopus androsaceus JB14]|uniref:Uncharacterized protein n=1 Tax=Gymnopus androsaceus JB14 TaxID=1447944 RepID=A0A6A4IGU8_9AGAR|nr:hypothetical protein BT96DRAFT_913625 [Gymnopus androsaceus JB14]
MLEEMFSRFTFPSLKELIIYSEDGSSASLIWPLYAFSAFMSRSSCILTMLSLSSVMISDSDLVATLRLLPSLTKWSIDGLANSGGGSPIMSHFISHMHASSAAPLLPKLHSLSIKSHGTVFDNAAFVSMVSSRWLPDRTHAVIIGIDCLRSLVLHFAERELDKEAYRPLFDLDRKGMRVVITGRIWGGRGG